MASWIDGGSRLGRLQLLLLALAAALCAPIAQAAPPAALAIVTLTNRADLVSDEDVLTEIVLPAASDPRALKVTLNGRDVSRAFARRSDGRVKGLLTGLSVGDNTVRATLPGFRAAELHVVDHPRSGTIFSGPFPGTPYYCATPTPQPAHGGAPATNASGLSGQPDARCQIETEYKLYYRTTAAGCSLDAPDASPPMPADATVIPPPRPPPANPCFKLFDASKPRPADIATVTTAAGQQAPYVVRVERGVINRGIYDIAVLYDPTRPWSALEPQPQWNRKVYYQFAGGTSNPHRQYRPTTPWTVDLALSRGFIVAQNSMSDSMTNSNRVLSDETVMMMKEHIGDAYGEILYTHATGCSGGAVNSLTTMSLSPNLVDGFTVACSLMDTETSSMELNDCILLVEAYDKPAFLRLMEEGSGGRPYSQAEVNAMKAAINGHRDHSACQDWLNLTARRSGNNKPGNYFPRVVAPKDFETGRITQLPTSQNNCELPAGVVYDRVSNPGGVRCGPTDWSIAIWGKGSDGLTPADTRDNVGVQYGLLAFLDGRIPAEVFVTLNESIGGYDKDSNLVDSRMAADESALRTAYRTGLVVTGSRIARHAQIDLRSYDDSTIDAMPGAVTFGVHQIWRSYSLRDRLDRDTGGHGAHVMWRYGRTGILTPPVLSDDALTVMDDWLTALKRDASSDPVEVKVLRAKPSSAVDLCLLSNDAAQATKVRDQALCDADPYLRPSKSPRQVAGGPRTEDILKCRLRRFEPADYGNRLSPSQVARLRTVFRTGVCDWSKPGVGQVPPSQYPNTFGAQVGGVSIGPPPVSQLR